ncbi:hypothetical protein [Rubrivirga litoralis]|uniref:Lipoprotein n=1 Tax=Rubrivirga litoralis TaxID=3075598 RepID=A0ABU3BSI3_9BACT|nr:hypothetical protein [Rubrivirga sp. F394]MDT0632244.1 hypothetical protein [Rubrivirga sp. F394]
MRIATLSLAFLLSACDGGLDGGGTPFVYATDGTDIALDLAQGVDGALVVVGSTEGVPRPADGTLALPTVLRFGLDGALLSSEVYRDVGFGDATAALPMNGGLVVAVAAEPDDGSGRSVRLYRTDGRGGRERVLIQPETASFAPPRALLPAPGGGVYAAVYATLAGAPTLYRVGSDGGVVWAGRLEGAQDVRTLAPAPDGLYVMGPQSAGGGTVVARLDADGAERWRVVRPETDGAGWRATHLAATADGVVLLESRAGFADGSAVRVVRVSAEGEVGAAAVLAEAAGADGPDGEPEPVVRGAALAALPGGGLAVGVVRGGDFDGPPPEATVVTLDAGGAAVARRSFGVRGRWTSLNALLPLADGRLAAAGAVGPRTVSGYGGDDFDVRVEIYPAD